MAKPTAKTAADDGRVEYAVRPGIDRINGEKLRGARSVRLLPREAAYLLKIGQVAPAGQRPAAWDKSAPKADGAEG
ncbi:hypothetical protein [Aurantimonas phage AmM-1]|uniref:hypothetical protein n=1 Tax=Aurantimonas phage AmM-1 TaxID=1503929 RepID=UPI000540BEA0|nr:hypothetical protein ACQ23_gp13 [Aurantimonas phage AmM-1]BAP94470.1 hypothetical protein [Aurantimonas phage AmM-1]